MILFFGSAGAGKSVQGQQLAGYYGMPWVSTGAMLRASGDPRVISELQQGHLIADSVMYELLHETLLAYKGRQWIMDGFPRTVQQADWLMDHQDTYDYTVDVAVLIEIPEEEAVSRLMARGRSDDTPASISHRLKAFHAQVDPILAYLDRRGVPIVRIDGVGEIDHVQATIQEQLREYL